MRTILLVAALLPSVAGAANWMELSHDSQMQISMDNESVDSWPAFDDVYTKAWLRINYQKAQTGQPYTNNLSYDQQLLLYYVRCSDKTFSVAQQIFFRHDNDVASRSYPLEPKSFREPPPDTLADNTVQILCQAAERMKQSNHDQPKSCAPYSSCADEFAALAASAPPAEQKR